MVVLAIGGEPGAVTGSFLKAGRYTFPFLRDGDAAVSGYFGVSVIPTTIVIDEKGRIAGSIVGEAPAAQLRLMVQKAKCRQRKSNL